MPVRVATLLRRKIQQLALGTNKNYFAFAFARSAI
jgi:hypothetical protein